MTAEQLAAIAGAILSLLFSYVPGLNTWYAALGTEVKRLIMLVFLVLTAAGAYAVSCGGYGGFLGLEPICNAEGIASLVMALISAIVANQSIFKLSPVMKSVKEAKA